MTGLSAGTVIAALGAFFWGMISVVFSPCYLASIPLIVAYVGGQEKWSKSRTGRFLFPGLYLRTIYHHCPDWGYLCPLGPDAGGYWQLLADPGGVDPDLGGLGHAWG